ncbi:MAG: PEP-CTERM sorting domain-containing protein [Zoogloeaceae bacterium]|nr:PEP-CTERM sorting domain-containing protein [Zoogloeaceae bacterium]
MDQMGESNTRPSRCSQDRSQVGAWRSGFLAIGVALATVAMPALVMAGPATQTIGGDFHLGKDLIEEIDGTAPGSFDRLIVAGTTTFAPGARITFDLRDMPFQQAGLSWEFFLAADFVDLPLLSYAMTGLQPGLGFEVQAGPAQDGRQALRLVLIEDTNDLPEPSTIALLGLALAGLGWAGHRRESRRRTLAGPVGSPSQPPTQSPPPNSPPLAEPGKDLPPKD